MLTRRGRIRFLAALLVVALSALAIAVWSEREPHPDEAEIVFVDGLPHVDYKGSIGVQENPTTVAGWGSGEAGDPVTAADWLVEHQGVDGAWRYGFDYVVTGRAQLQQGWASAIAQGRSLSVLALAHDGSPREAYVVAMRRAVQFLEVSVVDGGVRTELDGALWFEEYPTDPASYVLNGYLYLLEGLWNSERFVPSGMALYNNARRTLENNLYRWDVDGLVSYDLLHESVGGDPWIDRSYDEVHRRLLKLLLEHRPSEGVAR